MESFKSNIPVQNSVSRRIFSVMLRFTTPLRCKNVSLNMLVLCYRDQRDSKSSVRCLQRKCTIPSKSGLCFRYLFTTQWEGNRGMAENGLCPQRLLYFCNSLADLQKRGLLLDKIRKSQIQDLELQARLKCYDGRIARLETCDQKQEPSPKKPLHDRIDATLKKWKQVCGHAAINHRLSWWI